MVGVLLLLATQVIVASADVGGASLRRADFVATPRGSGQRLAVASAPVAGSSGGKEKVLSVGSTGNLKKVQERWPDEVLDPALAFSGSKKVLAQIKSEFPVRRAEWLKGAVQLKSDAAKARVEAAAYEKKMAQLDATVAMADTGVIHLREHIASDHVANANKIRDHLKTMKKDVSMQLGRAAVAGSPVEHSAFDTADQQAIDLESNPSEALPGSRSETGSEEAQAASSEKEKDIEDVKSLLEKLIRKSHSDADHEQTRVLAKKKANAQRKKLIDQLGVPKDVVDEIDKTVLKSIFTDDEAKFQEAYDTRMITDVKPQQGEGDDMQQLATTDTAQDKGTGITGLD